MITPLPTPPNTSDSGNFDERADAFLSALPQFADEMNAYSKEFVEDTTQKVSEIVNATRDELIGKVDEGVAKIEANVKSGILTEVATQTRALNRQSFRLLDFASEASLNFTPYQEVLRENSENNFGNIVHYGDIFKPEILYAKSTFSKSLLAKISLPRTLREVREHKNDIKYSISKGDYDFIITEGEETFLCSVKQKKAKDDVWKQHNHEIQVFVDNSIKGVTLKNVDYSGDYLIADVYYQPDLLPNNTHSTTVNLYIRQKANHMLHYFSDYYALILETKMLIVAKTIDKIVINAGHRYTRTISGAKINTISISALFGVCSYEISEDSLEAKVHYDAPLTDKGISDEITLNVNDVPQIIAVQIKPIEDTHQNRLDKNLNYAHIKGCSYGCLVAPEPLGNFVFFIGKTRLNQNDNSIANIYNTELNKPLKITFPARVKKFICGGSYNPTFNTTHQHLNAVLLEDGSVWVQGTNTNGELGIGNTIDSVYFIKNPYLSDIKDIFMGGLGFGQFALTNANKLYAWGANTNSMLGLSSTEDKILKPTLIEQEFSSNITDVARCNNRVFIVLEEGKVLHAGLNANQLTDNADCKAFHPVKVDEENELTNIKAVGIMSACVLFLSKNKMLYASDGVRFQTENNTAIYKPQYTNIDKVKELKTALAFNNTNSLAVLLREGEETSFYVCGELNFLHQYAVGSIVSGQEQKGQAHFHKINIGKSIVEIMPKIEYAQSTSNVVATVSLVLYDKSKDGLFHSTGFVFEKLK